MTFKPKGSDLKKSISKSRKGYLKVKFLGILLHLEKEAEKSQTSGGAPAQQSCGACKAPPH